MSKYCKWGFSRRFTFSKSCQGPRGVFGSKAISVLVHSNTFKNLRFVDMLWQRQLNQDAMHLHFAYSSTRISCSKSWQVSALTRFHKDVMHKIFTCGSSFSFLTSARTSSHTPTHTLFLKWLSWIIYYSTAVVSASVWSHQQWTIFGAPLQKLSQGGGHQ